MNTSIKNPDRDHILRELTFDWLSSHSNPLSDAISTSSIPRYFNPDILRIIFSINEADANNLYQQMLSVPFVQPFDEGSCTIFDSIRAILLDDWRNPAKR